MMLSHFAARDEMEFLFENGDATFLLSLFVQNLQYHNFSKAEADTNFDLSKRSGSK